MGAEIVVTGRLGKHAGHMSKWMKRNSSDAWPGSLFQPITTLLTSFPSSMVYLHDRCYLSTSSNPSNSSRFVIHSALRNLPPLPSSHRPSQLQVRSRPISPATGHTCPPPPLTCPSRSCTPFACTHCKSQTHLSTPASPLPRSRPRPPKPHACLAGPNPPNATGLTYRPLPRASKASFTKSLVSGDTEQERLLIFYAGAPCCRTSDRLVVVVCQHSVGHTSREPHSLMQYRCK